LAKISIVGAGPGSPDYVTPIAKKTVKNAQVVIGAERALNLFADDIKGEKLKLTAKNLTDTLNQGIELAQKGKTVAIISTGDPGFSGLLGTFSKVAMGKSVELEVVPGISSIQVCAARLSMPWDAACLFSFHEGVSAEEKQELANAVKEGNDVILLPDSRGFSPSEVAKFLVNGGVDAETPVFVCENLTLSDEQIVRTTLGKVPGVSFGSLCVMIIKPSRITR
jgi:cobalt-precorrin-7 (C5)-methyltransferase